VASAWLFKKKKKKKGEKRGNTHTIHGKFILAFASSIHDKNNIHGIV
jgi:hypothetical protein